MDDDNSNNNCNKTNKATTSTTAAAETTTSTFVKDDDENNNNDNNNNTNNKNKTVLIADESTDDIQTVVVTVVASKTTTTTTTEDPMMNDNVDVVVAVPFITNETKKDHTTVTATKTTTPTGEITKLEDETEPKQEVTKTALSTHIKPTTIPPMSVTTTDDYIVITTTNSFNDKNVDMEGITTTISQKKSSIIENEFMIVDDILNYDLDDVDSNQYYEPYDDTLRTTTTKTNNENNNHVNHHGFQKEVEEHDPMNDEHDTNNNNKKNDFDDDDDDIDYENLELNFDDLYVDHNEDVEEYFVQQASPITVPYHYDDRKDGTTTAAAAVMSSSISNSNSLYASAAAVTTHGELLDPQLLPNLQLPPPRLDHNQNSNLYHQQQPTQTQNQQVASLHPSSSYYMQDHHYYTSLTPPSTASSYYAATTTSTTSASSSMDQSSYMNHHPTTTTTDTEGRKTDRTMKEYHSDDELSVNTNNNTNFKKGGTTSTKFHKKDHQREMDDYYSVCEDETYILGTLIVRVVAAKGLPCATTTSTNDNPNNKNNNNWNQQSSSSNNNTRRRHRKMNQNQQQPYNTPDSNNTGTNPYASIRFSTLATNGNGGGNPRLLNQQQVQRTSTVYHTCNPVWPRGENIMYMDVSHPMPLIPPSSSSKQSAPLKLNLFGTNTSHENDENKMTSGYPKNDDHHDVSDDDDIDESESQQQQQYHHHPGDPPLKTATMAAKNSAQAAAQQRLKRMNSDDSTYYSSSGSVTSSKKLSKSLSGNNGGGILSPIISCAIFHAQQNTKNKNKKVSSLDSDDDDDGLMKKKKNTTKNNNLNSVIGDSDDWFLGMASLDVTPLLTGKVNMMDEWLTLSGGVILPPNHHHNTTTASNHNNKKQPPSQSTPILSSVRIICEYEPTDPLPQLGDYVQFTKFCHPMDLYPLLVHSHQFNRTMYKVEEIYTDQDDPNNNNNHNHTNGTIEMNDGGSYLLISHTVPSGTTAGWVSTFLVHRFMVMLCKERELNVIEYYQDEFITVAERVSKSELIYNVQRTVNVRVPEDGLIQVSHDVVSNVLSTVFQRWLFNNNNDYNENENNTTTSTTTKKGLELILDDLNRITNWDGQHTVTTPTVVYDTEFTPGSGIGIGGGDDVSVSHRSILDIQDDDNIDNINGGGGLNRTITHPTNYAGPIDSVPLTILENEIRTSYLKQPPPGTASPMISSSMSRNYYNNNNNNSNTTSSILPNMPSCPITGVPMIDPVVAADGHTYERQAIARWLRSHDTSPLTGTPLPHKNLVPNYMLLSSLQDLLSNNNRTNNNNNNNIVDAHLLRKDAPPSSTTTSAVPAATAATTTSLGTSMNQAVPVPATTTTTTLKSKSLQHQNSSAGSISGDSVHTNGNDNEEEDEYNKATTVVNIDD